MTNERKQRLKRKLALQARAEQMEVEFVGGPYDGTRLDLHVVRLRKGDIRVLGKTYEPMFDLDKAAEVEA